MHRVTEQNDVTKVSGRQFVIDKINAANKNHQHIMLFASMPCTGGSLWGNINRHKQGGEAKLRKHWSLFRKIWKCFEECAILVLNLGGCVALEWPKGCRYWQWDFVKAFLECYNFSHTCFDGCTLDLRSSVDSSKFIKKPWMPASTCPSLSQVFQHNSCKHDHEHVPCAGVDTTLTEQYTMPMVVRVHEAFSQHALLTRNGNISENKISAFCSTSMMTAADTHKHHCVALPALLIRVLSNVKL